jgi:hypothetical protein
MPRMVGYSIIQAANAVPATEPMATQKRAIVEKHGGGVGRKESHEHSNLT